MPSSCLCHSLLFPFPRPRCDPFWTLVCPFFSSCVVWKSAKTGTWNWKQQCRQPKGGAKSFQPGSNAWAAVFSFWKVVDLIHLLARSLPQKLKQHPPPTRNMLTKIWTPLSCRPTPVSSSSDRASIWPTSHAWRCQISSQRSQGHRRF